MQTSLLAVGIAIILALLTALVGPFFVSWSDYRGVFEQRASRVLGMPVRISGRIDARLLPAPSVTLRGVEATGPSGEVRLKVKEIGLELALGRLLQGEWRATQMRLVGPEVTLGLDDDQTLDWKLPADADADAFAIDRFTVEDGRARFNDAATGAVFAIEALWFGGELRSLAGPVKGEGGFVANDERHNFRLALGRAGDDGARLRLSIDPLDRPLSFDADGTLKIEKGAPRFEGATTLARQPGVVMARGRAVNSEPWRLAGRVKLTLAGALVEQLDLQYGPEERGLKFGGAAELKFGERPRLEAVLSARQLDLDRLVALPEGVRRLPLVALRTAAESLGDAIQPSIPVRLGIGIETVTVGGAVVQAVRGDLTADAGGWEFETLEFRAPGFTQVRASGRVTWAATGASFAGPASVSATDPKGLLAWIEGRAAKPGPAMGPLRAVGDLTLASDRIAVERLRAEVDRKPLTGRLDYAWGGNGREPRLEADIKAADLDLDAAIGAIRAALPDARFDLPGEFALSLDLGRATLAGFEARNAKAKLRLNAGGLVVERLGIDDFAGAGIDLRGRIDALWTAPRGALDFELAASRLDGLAALAESAAPTLAKTLRAVSGRAGPFKLRGNVTVADASAGGRPLAGFTLAGTAGALRLSLKGDLAGELAAWRRAELKANARLEADDGRALARLLGIEQALGVAAAPANAQVSFAGPLDGALELRARLAAGGLEGSASGAITLGDAGPAGQGEVTLAAGNVLAVRAPGSRAREPLPLTLKSRFALTAEQLTLDTMAGVFAGSAFNGSLGLVFGTPLRLEGALDADKLNASAVFATLFGVPVVEGGGQAPWSAQPFAPGLLSGLQGQIALSATLASVMPGVELRQLQAVLRLGDAEAAVEDIKGLIGGGRLAGHLSLPRSADGGRALDARFGVTGADIATLLAGGARPAIAGRLSAQIEIKGGGRTPAALIGGLGGAGTLSVEDVALSGLDPQVFASVTRATDQGADVDGAKIKHVVEAALERGPLRIASADGTLSVTAGQLRLSGLVAKATGGDLTVYAVYDLSQGALDARLALGGGGDARVAGLGRPEIFVGLKGPAMAPQKSVDVSALVGWLTLRAVDLQAKRLEDAESRAQIAAPPSTAPPSAAPASAAPAPVPTPAASVAPQSAVAEPVASIPVSAPAAAPLTPLPPVMAPDAGPQPAPPAQASPEDEGRHDAGEPANATLPSVAPPGVARPGPPPSRVAPSRRAPPEAGAPSPRTAAPAHPPARLNPPYRANGGFRPPAPIRPDAVDAAGQPRLAPSAARGRGAPAPVAAEQAPPLAPPIDIRPPPTPRRAPARASADDRPRPPAAIPGERSRSGGLFDLFGVAR